jgi:hypothetical protein
MTGLTAINIPASIEIIGEECFAACESLSSITFESGSKLAEGQSHLLAGSPLSYGTAHKQISD